MILGNTHSGYFTNNGDLYIVGSNTNGELGLGHMQMVNNFTKPDKSFFSNIRIKGFAIGDNFTAVLLENGDLYTFGKNDLGQIIQIEYKNYPLPEKVGDYFYDVSTIKDITTNQDTLLVNTISDDIYIFGKGDFIKDVGVGFAAIKYMIKPSYYNHHNYS